MSSTSSKKLYGAGRRKLYLSLEELQTDLDAWLAYYNSERTHQGKMCCGRTHLQTLILNVGFS